MVGFSEITTGLSISAFAADDGRRAQVGDLCKIRGQEKHFWAIVVIDRELPYRGFSRGYHVEEITGFLGSCSASFVGLSNLGPVLQLA